MELSFATANLLEPLWQKKHIVSQNTSIHQQVNKLFVKTHLAINNLLAGTLPNIVGQICVFGHLTDKRLENEKFKVSVKCLFYQLWIGHLTYRSDSLPPHGRGA